MAKRVAGTCTIKYDGKQLSLKASLNVSISRFERKGIAGLDRVHGYSEEPRVPFIEADVTLGSDTSVTELDGIDDATVIAQLANGKTYTLFEAWTKSAHEINASEGTTRVRFEGMRGEEF